MKNKGIIIFKYLKTNNLAVFSLFIFGIILALFCLNNLIPVNAGRLLHYSWPPAKNTINQVIHNTPWFWYYVQVICVLGLFVTLITLVYVEQRWYTVIGWGWASIFITVLVMVTSGFNGTTPLYLLSIIDCLILVLIFRYWFLDGRWKTLKAIILMSAFFTLFLSGLILYMGYILYGPHIKIMIPSSPANFHYLPFIEVYKYYYPNYSRLLFFSINPEFIPQFFKDSFKFDGNIDPIINKLIISLRKLLDANFAYYAGNKAAFPWPMMDETLLGKHFIDNYIDLLMLKNPHLPSAYLKSDFYNNIIHRYNRLHFNLMPFKEFMGNEQALKLLFLTVKPNHTPYSNFTILIGLSTHLNIEDMVSVDPYTAEVLMAASNYSVTKEISLYHWLGVAKVFQHSMLEHSHIYGTILYDYYGRIFFWKVFLISSLTIILIHLIEPGIKKLQSLEFLSKLKKPC